LIKRSSELTETIKENMRGGDGKVKITSVLDEGDYDGKSRLVAVLAFEPGSSIGKHTHENEEEIFYVLEGSAAYDDNGAEVILNAGESAVCKNGQSHAVCNKSDKMLKLFAIILKV